MASAIKPKTCNAVDFYTRRLGFKLEQQQLPAFATVSLAPDAEQTIH